MEAAGSPQVEPCGGSPELCDGSNSPSRFAVSAAGADATGTPDAGDLATGEPQQDAGPRSTSSAMPDLHSPRVPALRAKVHQCLSDEDCKKLPLSSLRFRPLNADDLQEMVALHQEWFPVAYDDNFYDKAVTGEIFTLAAIYTPPATPAHAGGSPPIGGDGRGRGYENEHVLGLLTMSTCCELHGEDIVNVLGGDCDELCREGLGTETPVGRLAYILTLGVVDGFRRRGLARLLLRHLVQHVDDNMPTVDAIYLHVVTYNQAAVCLYESADFLQLQRYPSFYSLHDKPYDSFLYAFYVHQGRPPWKFRFARLLAFGPMTSWRHWVASAWSAFWPIGNEANAPPVLDNIV